MVFPVGMYGCESWTIKKAECQIIDAFELWCWRRLLRAAWTARRSNQSILKEISPEYPLERLLLKLKLQTLATWCEERTHLKRPWWWERLKAGGDGTTEDEMVGWHHQLDEHEFEQVLGFCDGQGSLVCCSPWGFKESDTTELLNWLWSVFRRHVQKRWTGISIWWEYPDSTNNLYTTYTTQNITTVQQCTHRSELNMSE